MIFPSWEHQHGRVALEGFRQHLGALDTKANAIVFDGGERGLRDACTLRELVLTQALQLANNAHWRSESSDPKGDETANKYDHANRFR